MKSARDERSDDAGNRKRRRSSSTNFRQPSWKDQPGFMDASASISSATFGARRLIELEQLYHTSAKGPIQTEEVAFRSGGGQTSSRHLRRRTTSHQTRRHRHRFPVRKGQEEVQNQNIKSTSRKARRSSKRLLCQSHLQWQNSETPKENDGSSTMAINETTVTQSSCCWMTTHLWHAKRFRMETLWGWRLPILHTNRGARAAIRLSATHCTLQDLTFERQPCGPKAATTMLSSTVQCGMAQFVACIAQVLPAWGTDPTIVSRLQQDQPVMGEAVLHYPNQFPRGAVGPVWWQIDGQKPWKLMIRSHPSIRSIVSEVLVGLQTSNPSLLRWSRTAATKELQLCCFRICGASASNLLQNALQLCSSSTQKNRVSDRSDAPFLSQNQVMEWQHGHVLLTTARRGDALDDMLCMPISLVRQLPRPLNCDVNRAVAGWDLYCSCQDSNTLWMALAMKCAVLGLVEQASIHLESEPPLPVFPRDFLDTEACKEYWLTQAPNDQVSGCSPLRRYLDGDWGRKSSGKQLRFQKREIAKPPMEGTNENEYSEEVTCFFDHAVVRGAFGEPFEAVIEGCAQTSSDISSEQDVDSGRRNRRRSKPKNSARIAPPLSREQQESWKTAVSGLSRNLTLSAALHVHIRLEGEGVARVGDEIGIHNAIVGRVLASQFSPSRGTFHGLGIIRADQFLVRLASFDEDHPSSPGRVVRLLGGKKQLHVQASLHTATSKVFKILLSLVL